MFKTIFKKIDFIFHHFVRFREFLVYLCNSVSHFFHRSKQNCINKIISKQKFINNEHLFALEGMKMYFYRHSETLTKKVCLRLPHVLQLHNLP